MNKRDLFRFIFIALPIFFLVHLSLFSILKIKQKNFSQDELKRLIYSVSTLSRLRSVASDPCQHALAKDAFSNNYIKISFQCSPTSRSVDTLDLDVLPDRTIRGFIKEISRIKNFDPQIILGKTKWLCISATTLKPIDFDQMVQPNDKIYCYADSSLKDIR